MTLAPGDKIVRTPLFDPDETLTVLRIEGDVAVCSSDLDPGKEFPIAVSKVEAAMGHGGIRIDRSGETEGDEVGCGTETGYETDLGGGLCKCGNPAGEPEECPYALEIHDKKQICTCCESCRQNCADDI